MRDVTTGEPLQEVIISVSAETRGRGIGRRLMEGLLDHARAAGCSGLSLTVSERNPPRSIFTSRSGSGTTAKSRPADSRWCGDLDGCDVRRLREPRAPRRQPDRARRPSAP
ncbi:MAG: GNAT family N-acetyltransferase [Solirubrobacteraceae bacterium]